VTRAPAAAAAGGDREALLARRAVGYVAHRVDRLVRRAGGDQHVLAVKRPVLGLGGEIGLALERIEAVAGRRRLGRALQRIDLVVDRLEVGRRRGSRLALHDQHRTADKSGSGSAAPRRAARPAAQVGEVLVVVDELVVGDPPGVLRGMIEANRPASPPCLRPSGSGSGSSSGSSSGASSGSKAWRYSATSIAPASPGSSPRSSAISSQTISGSGRRPGPNSPARHLAVVGLHHADAGLAEPFDVAPGRGVLPHLDVHRRDHEHRLVGGENQRGAEIVSDAGRHLGHQVRPSPDK
jgi:hypothetical protein